jgi:hypothetical protein
MPKHRGVPASNQVSVLGVWMIVLLENTLFLRSVFTGCSRNSHMASTSTLYETVTFSMMAWFSWMLPPVAEKSPEQAS